MAFFVRREKDLRDAIETLANTAEGVVWDIVGIHGIGKSVFLDQVQSEADGLGAMVRVLKIDMSGRGLEEEFHGDYGNDASASVLWQTFLRSCELMRYCADHFKETLRCDDFDKFVMACELQGKKAEIFTTEHSALLESRGPRRASVAEQKVKEGIRGFQKTVDNEFIEAWTSLTSNRRILVLLDSFDSLADDELGHWMVDMALKCPKTLTMVARAPSKIKFSENSKLLKTIFLAPFSLDQVNKYLAARFSGEKPHRISELAKVVHTYTDGHAGGMDLAARLISEKGADIEVRALRRIFDRLPDDPEKRWASLVRLILDAVHDPVLRKAVDAASVSLSFDEPLLAKLLGLDPHKERGAGDALEALKDCRLIERARDVGSGSNRYRLHEFIRLSLADDLRDHATQWQTLHRLAAQHYFDELQKDEPEETGGAYGQWFLYERPDWQACKQHWIYHSGQLSEYREITRSRFVLIFLEAFWWWGCYHPFSFNPRLIEDWERAAATWAGNSLPKEAIKDQQLADALWFLINNYPHGHIKSPTAPWKQMRAELERVLGLCKLSPEARRPAPAERREMARARALVRIFLAHTVRYRDHTDTDADDYYAEALRTFEKQKDDWVVSWLLFETADLAMERGQADKSVSLVAKSAKRILESTLTDDDSDNDTGEESDLADDYDLDEQGGKWDYELLAQLHRVRADVQWMCGERAGAAVRYGRAVANAYWFQGDAHPPDPYTQRFYAEITGRAAERIHSLVESDESQALEFIAGVRAQLPAAASTSDPVAVIRSGQPAEMRSLLFPRGPEGDDEIGPGPDASQFMDGWRILAKHRTDPVQELHELIDDNGLQ